MHQFERDFGHKLDNKHSIPEMAARGKPYVAIYASPAVLQQSQSCEYGDAILIDPQSWELPAGAYGEDTGPTVTEQSTTHQGRKTDSCGSLFYGESNHVTTIKALPAVLSSAKALF